MSYHYIFGASGAGKSHTLHREVIRRSLAAPDSSMRGNHFLVIVPDQYSMQTQKDLVEAHPYHGIMNVEVLSFGRLGHRIFEETGADSRRMLDDLGKMLLLRKAASECDGDLSVLSGKLKMTGMLTEAKSILSEFMQYGIGTDRLDAMISDCEKDGKAALAARLSDLKVLSDAFRNAERGGFITGEETLQAVAEAIPASRLIRDSVVVFDGFTGFTPLQYQVLEQLLSCAKEVIFTLLWSPDGDKDPVRTSAEGRPGNEQSLFCLTRKTICAIDACAERQGAVHDPDVLLTKEKDSRPVYRFLDNPVLSHLEKHLYRYPSVSYTGRDTKEHLEIFSASSPEEEVREICMKIRQLTQDKGYAYRDLAVVTGDLAGYSPYFRRLCPRYGIPFYIDETRSVEHHPLIETLKSALTVRIRHFSAESVFRYLRAGMSDLPPEMTDRLENHCLAHGIGSFRKWSLPFPEELEEGRKRFIDGIAPLLSDGRSVKERCRALYDFMKAGNMYERLLEKAEEAKAQGDSVRRMEYERIYPRVIALLDQLAELTGDDKVTAEEFLQLFEAGAAEIRIGTLPQYSDRLLVGDMERTRLTDIRVLFFAGINDGIVPRAAKSGGLISDYEREYLLGRGHVLSPTPREKRFIERLYLYMNMTRPKDLLCLSFAERSADGKSLKPSYLIERIRDYFPDAGIRKPELMPAYERLFSKDDLGGYLSGEFRLFAEGKLTDPVRENAFFSCLAELSGDPLNRDEMERLSNAAFLRYVPVPLSPESTGKLFTDTVEGSVSRLEIMAQCALRHFLQYGLKLKERDVYQVEAADAGTVLHAALEVFSGKLANRGIRWEDFTGEQAEKLLDESISEVAAGYRDLVLYADARTTAMLARIRRILLRSVLTLQYQLRKGSFEPAGSEVPFGYGRDAGLMRYTLKDGKTLLLRGRIDRYDTADEGQGRYIKIVDYKSGERRLDPEKIEQGLQLQLPLYLTAAMRMERNSRPGSGILPAAMLYYRMDDPLMQEGASEEEMVKALQPQGIISRSETVVSLFDSFFSGQSDVIPVSRLKDGSLRKSQSLLEQAELELLLEKAQNAACRLSESILDGTICADPKLLAPDRTSCTYCPYKNACGFDRKLKGYGIRKTGSAGE